MHRELSADAEGASAAEPAADKAATAASVSVGGEGEEVSIGDAIMGVPGTAALTPPGDSVCSRSVRMHAD